MTTLSILELARLIIASGALLLGAAAVILGAVGLLRLGDIYERMHGAGVVETSGTGLILLGLLMLAPDWTVAARLVLIGALLVMTSPTATHAIARAASVAGVAPKLAQDATDEEPKI